MKIVKWVFKNGYHGNGLIGTGPNQHPIFLLDKFNEQSPNFVAVAAFIARKRIFEISVGTFYLPPPHPVKDRVKQNCIFSVPSSPPTVITANNTSSTAVIVTWQPLAKEHRNGLLLGYKVFSKSIIQHARRRRSVELQSQVAANHDVNRDSIFVKVHHLLPSGFLLIIGLETETLVSVSWYAQRRMVRFLVIL